MKLSVSDEKDDVAIPATTESLRFCFFTLIASISFKMAFSPISILSTKEGAADPFFLCERCASIPLAFVSSLAPYSLMASTVLPLYLKKPEQVNRMARSKISVGAITWYQSPKNGVSIIEE